MCKNRTFLNVLYTPFGSPLDVRGTLRYTLIDISHAWCDPEGEHDPSLLLPPLSSSFQSRPLGTHEHHHL